MGGMKTAQNPAPILDHAVAVEGGKAKLAAALNVTPAAITHWYARGLPYKVAADLVRAYGKRKVPKSPLEWKPKTINKEKEA